MRPKKWRGTVLFAGILAVMALTVGLRWYAEPASSAITAVGGTSSGTGSATGAGAVTGGSSTGSTGSAGSSSTPSASAPSSSAPASASGGSASTATKTVNGATEQTPYGPVQVAVTFSGTKIVKVTELQAPTGGRSDQINSYAGPILAQEVMASQSAKIDTVSGATYTSQSYAQSVQAAIDNR